MQIVLFGPIGVGKTSVAKKLSQDLDLKNLHSDILRDEYFKKYGLNTDEVTKIRTDNFEKFVDFMRPYELRFVEEVMCEYGKGNFIFDFGGGFSYYTEESQVKKFLEILKNFKNIFLLLPDQNLEVSEKILQDRIIKEFQDEKEVVSEDRLKQIFDVNKKFIGSNSSLLVANHVIYTSNDSVAEVVEKIKEKII